MPGVAITGLKAGALRRAGPRSKGRVEGITENIPWGAKMVWKFLFLLALLAIIASAAASSSQMAQLEILKVDARENTVRIPTFLVYMVVTRLDSDGRSFRLNRQRTCLQAAWRHHWFVGQLHITGKSRQHQ